MSFHSSCSSVAAIAAALVLQVILSPAPLFAQHDSTMMGHDSAMMGHDSAMMGHDSTMMMQDSTMKMHDSTMMMHGDSGMTMSHDSMGMDHGKMMDHQQMGGDNGAMTFTGAEGKKAAGTYALTETGGKRQLALSDDFSVSAAPDLYLVLAKGSTPDDAALYLGKVKKPAGAQTFDLPKGKDLAGYSTLLVWSKKDKLAVASAEWHATSGKMMDHK